MKNEMPTKKGNKINPIICSRSLAICGDGEGMTRLNRTLIFICGSQLISLFFRRFDTFRRRVLINPPWAGHNFWGWLSPQQPHSLTTPLSTLAVVPFLRSIFKLFPITIRETRRVSAEGWRETCGVLH